MERHLRSTTVLQYLKQIMYVACCVCSSWSVPVGAEHPIDVEYASAQGEHLRALVTFDTLPQRIRTVSATIAATKSAWAMSLSRRAIDEIDALLARKDLPVSERTELLLTRGIIELQENRPQVAALYAEKTVTQCGEKCSLLTRAYMLWGDAVQVLGALGAAEGYYERALETASSFEETELLYRRGVCRYHLGRLDEAREDFKKLPLTSDRTSSALRYLAQIALAQKEASVARVYLDKGRELFPQEFLDSWVMYARMSAAIQERNHDAVHTLRAEAIEKYPPSDGWITLLHASVESYEWSKMHGGKR